MSNQYDSQIQDLGLHTTESAIALLTKLRHYKVKNYKTGKLTNRRERTFCAACNVELPTSEDTYLPGYAHLTISYKQAVKHVTALLRNFEARGARIAIKASEQCIFIG